MSRGPIPPKITFHEPAVTFLATLTCLSTAVSGPVGPGFGLWSFFARDPEYWAGQGYLFSAAAGGNFSACMLLLVAGGRILGLPGQETRVRRA